MPFGREHYIIVDCLVTKRKYFHGLFAPDETPIYKSRLLSDCIDAARAIDVSTLRVLDAQSGLLLGVLQLSNLED